MTIYDNIRSVHLEISSRCNAACPDCPRNLRGMDIEDLGLFEIRDLSLSEIQKIFPIKFLNQINNILINGNHGDFITCRDALEIVQYFSSNNPQLNIAIQTNGSGRPGIWKPLAEIKNIVIYFAIDGLADTHEIYRQYTDFDQILKNAQAFISAGGCAIWKMIPFDYNCHQIEEAKSMAQKLGFHDFWLNDLGRNKMPVFDRKGNYKRTIGNPQLEIKDSKVLMQMFLDGIKNQDHKKIYQSIKHKHIRCRVADPQDQINQIYVQSNGQVYPCCWIGGAPDSMKHVWGNDQIRDICRNNNALEVGLENAVNWFESIKRSWDIPDISQGRLLICNETCGINH